MRMLRMRVPSTHPARSQSWLGSVLAATIARRPRAGCEGIAVSLVLTRTSQSYTPVELYSSRVAGML